MVQSWARLSNTDTDTNTNIKQLRRHTISQKWSEQKKRRMDFSPWWRVYQRQRFFSENTYEFCIIWDFHSKKIWPKSELNISHLTCWRTWTAVHFYWPSLQNGVLNGRQNDSFRVILQIDIFQIMSWPRLQPADGFSLPAKTDRTRQQRVGLRRWNQHLADLREVLAG